MILIELIAGIILLAGSAFFSASETALVSLSAQKAKQLALRNPRIAQAMVGWLNQPQELLIVILVGNTFTIVLFAALSTAILIRLFPNIPHSAIETTAWLFQSVGLVILVELAPKFFARANAEKTSLFVLPTLAILRSLMRPLLYFISLMRSRFSKPWKYPPVGQVLTFSLEELRGLIEEENRPAEPGAGEPFSMMERALSMHDKKASDIMIPASQVDMMNLTPVGKPPPAHELLLDLIIEAGHTRTPILKNEKVIGFIHSDDLFPFILSNREIRLDHLIRRAMDVPEDQSVGVLLQRFQSSGIYLGFVRGINGDFLGLVTLEDVMEEITGEILDEYDLEERNTEAAS